MCFSELEKKNVSVGWCPRNSNSCEGAVWILWAASQNPVQPQCLLRWGGLRFRDSWFSHTKGWLKNPQQPPPSGMPNLAPTFDAPFSSCSCWMWHIPFAAFHGLLYEISVPGCDFQRQEPRREGYSAVLWNIFSWVPWLFRILMRHSGNIFQPPSLVEQIVCSIPSGKIYGILFLGFKDFLFYFSASLCCSFGQTVIC